MDSPLLTPELRNPRPGEFHAASGYPSLRPVTTGVLTGEEREGSGRSLTEQSLAWFPMPGGPQGELPVHDGWRDYDYGRRRRVAFDLERFDKRQKQPYDR